MRLGWDGIGFFLYFFTGTGCSQHLFVIISNAGRQWWSIGLPWFRWSMETGRCDQQWKPYMWGTSLTRCIHKDIPIPGLHYAHHTVMIGKHSYSYKVNTSDCFCKINDVIISIIKEIKIKSSKCTFGCGCNIHLPRQISSLNRKITDTRAEGLCGRFHNLLTRGQ